MKDKSGSDQTPLIERNPWLFIVVYGVLFWGVTTAVLYSALMSFLFDDSMWDIFSYSIIVFPIGGFAWGGAMLWWYKTNQKKKS
ncbi:hypothetical protein [Gracilimonas sp.]|uniref:hypothetical protein n=1 Tax=Gracilimonas sp. TaxID=1974203 RepID=UPI002872310D|nr:hypothetical protein [Gracilimonas sp.]